MNFRSDHKNKQNAITTYHQQLRQLENAARQLRLQSGTAPPFRLALMTDENLMPDPLSLVSLLPKDTALIFRHYFAPERATLAKQVREACKLRGLPFLVAGDPALARKVRADGLHLPSWLLPKRGLWQGFSGLISASCHTPKDIHMALQSGIDIGLVSPVWPTRSHPGARFLGPAGLRSLARNTGFPLLALGGMTVERAQRLHGKNIAGIAAISAFLPEGLQRSYK